MIKSGSKKAEIIDVLQIALQKGQRLRMILRLRKDEENVRKTAASNRALAREIEGLIAAAMRDWTGSADDVIADIKTANAGLQRSIRDIEKMGRTAERVTKALGKLDEVINRASALL